jgi:uroporphyrinogen decarboxylase
MDLAAALAQVPADVVVCGNLDPTGVFVQASTLEIAARTRELLATTRTHRNFVISSGCDVPPSAPLANLDAFHQAVAQSPLATPGDLLAPLDTPAFAPARCRPVADEDRLHAGCV